MPSWLVSKYTVSAWHYNQSASVADQSVVVKADAAAPLMFKLALKPPVAETDQGY
ncbi:hypothetical protein LP420_00280 [Massilia sp. B-10]|nr:hypothetical protein LP420_00280 [Massilia sp. B-10]